MAQDTEGSDSVAHLYILLVRNKVTRAAQKDSKCSEARSLIIVPLSVPFNIKVYRYLAKSETEYKLSN